MRLQLFKKHISSIEELKGVVYEAQSIFEVLKETDLLYKKSLIKRYLENKEQNELSEYSNVNVYDLSKLSLSFLLKRHVLKDSTDHQNKKLKKDERMKFSIKAEAHNKKSVYLILEHYEEDKLDEVLRYTEQYFSSHLKRKLTIWEKTIAFFKKLFRVKSKQVKQ